MCEGFCTVEVDPSPKFHAHDVGDPVEVSVNDTANGAVPLVGDAVNDAVGAVVVLPVTVIVLVDGALLPLAFVAVRVAV